MNNSNSDISFSYISDKDGNKYFLNEKLYENSDYHIICSTTKINNKEYFVKILNYGEIDDNKFKTELLQSYIKEADALMKLKNVRNIPHLKFSYDNKKLKKYYIVMDKIPGITLKQWMQSNKKDTLSYKDVTERLDIVRQISLIMQNVKINCIQLPHKDLKPENIIINDKTVYIIDFGCLLINRIRNIGTTNYQAPEQILSSDSHCSLTAKTDIFSLGQIMYELLNGKVPVFDTEYVDNIDGKTWHKRPKINKNLKTIKNLQYNELCVLAEKMTERDIDKRYTYDMVILTINKIIGAPNNGNRKRKFNS